MAKQRLVPLKSDPTRQAIIVDHGNGRTEFAGTSGGVGKTAPGTNPNADTSISTVTPFTAPDREPVSTTFARFQAKKSRPVIAANHPATTDTVKPGAVITYSTFGGEPRTVYIHSITDDIKNGRPGFDGHLVDEPDTSVWGYLEQVATYTKNPQPNIPVGVGEHVTITDPYAMEEGMTGHVDQVTAHAIRVTATTSDGTTYTDTYAKDHVIRTSEYNPEAA